jgi:hypothetical protein
MTFPYIPATMQVTSNTPQIVTRSLSGFEQRAQVSSQYFSFTGSYSNFTIADSKRAMGAIMANRGSFNTFALTLPDDLKNTSSGYAGTVTNPTGAAAATSVTATVTWTSGTVPILRAGDLIKFSNHNKTYMVTADVNATSTTVTINFFPGLRTAQTTAGSVTVNNVAPTVRLATDQFDVGLGNDLFGNFSIDFIEVVN